MDEDSPYPRSDVTGVVLAGGAGRRMGGIDKGLALIGTRPMVAYVIDALAAQTNTVLINANRNVERYAAFGYRVISDSVGEFFGPLAGMATAMAAASTPYVLFAPCDSPLVALSLGQRLWQDLNARQADIAVAHDGERYHPVFALMRATLADSALDYLGRGERKIDRWFDQHRWCQVDCADIHATFANVNRPEEHTAIKERLMTHEERD